MDQPRLGRFGSRRLSATGDDLLAAMQQQRTMCLAALAEDRAGTRRFTDVLDNEAVTRHEMLTHAGRHVLAIADTSEINFATHTGRNSGFGTVGNGHDIGVFVHPIVAVDADHGGILGLVGAEVINRTQGRGVHDPSFEPVGMTRPDRAAPEGARHLSTPNPRPVVLFVDEDDPAFRAAAIAAGVCPYNRGTLAHASVRPVLRAAVALFGRPWPGLCRRLGSSPPWVTRRLDLWRTAGDARASSMRAAQPPLTVMGTSYERANGCDGPCRRRCCSERPSRFPDRQ